VAVLLCPQPDYHAGMTEESETEMGRPSLFEEALKNTSEGRSDETIIEREDDDKPVGVNILDGLLGGSEEPKTKD
jgi:hypothetical protein